MTVFDTESHFQVASEESNVVSKESESLHKMNQNHFIKRIRIALPEESESLFQSNRSHFGIGKIGLTILEESESLYQRNQNHILRRIINTIPKIKNHFI